MADIELDYSRLEDSLGRFMVRSKRELPDVIKSPVAKGVIRNIIADSPPIKKAFGQGAIRRDLMGGKGRAGIFFVTDAASLSGLKERSPEGLVKLWTTKDGRVYGTETTFFKPNASISDMAAHHARYFKKGRMSSAGAKTRDIGRWKFIDRMVVSKAAMSRFEQHLFKKLGKAASGWNMAAAKLGVKPPEYIWRHSGSGGFDVIVTDRSIRVKMSNRVDYAANIPRMNWGRVVQRALDKQAKLMDRVVKNHLGKMGKK
jgi:hypothetical protein